VLVVSKTNRAAIESNDAGRSAANDFNQRPVAKAQFVKPPNFVRGADELSNPGDLAATQQI
jgi:hypothetical protein